MQQVDSWNFSCFAYGDSLRLYHDFTEEVLANDTIVTWRIDVIRSLKATVKLISTDDMVLIKFLKNIIWWWNQNPIILYLVVAKHMRIYCLSHVLGQNDLFAWGYNPENTLINHHQFLEVKLNYSTTKIYHYCHLARYFSPPDSQKTSI